MNATEIEAKKQQLMQLTEKIEALTQELTDAGALELSDDDLDEVAGGFNFKKIIERIKQQANKN